MTTPSYLEQKIERLLDPTLVTIHELDVMLELVDDGDGDD